MRTGAKTEGRTHGLKQGVVATLVGIGLLAAAAGVAEAKPDGSSDELLRRARAALRIGQYEVAATTYEKLADRRSNDPVAFAGLGQARLRAGDVEGAIRALERAVELAPQQANLHANLGHAYSSAGQHEQARASFREALRLDPQHASAQRGLKKASAAPAEGSEATASAEAASEPEPVARPSSISDSTTPAAQRRWQLADAPEGDSPSETLRAQAREHYLAGRHAQALQGYQNAAVEDPSNAAAFAGIGASQLAMGRASAAADTYQTAVRLAPQSARLHAALGHAYAAAGQAESAEAAYRRALSLDSSLQAAKHGLHALKNGGGAAPFEQPSRQMVLASSEGPAPTPPWRKPGSKAPELPERWHFSKGSGASRTADAASASATDEQSAKADEQSTQKAEPPQPKAVSKPEPPRTASASAQPSRREPKPAKAGANAGGRAGDASGGNEGTPLDNNLLSSLMADPNGKSGSGASGAAAAAADLREDALGSAMPSAADMAEGKGKGPSRKQILQVMKPLKELVRQCAPEHRGVVKVDITVRGDDGKVSNATVLGKLADGMEATCISEVMRTASFPTFSKKQLTITFPYKL